jgi:glycosyltransferase involved in cell wall biosynthesis
MTPGSVLVVLPTLGDRLATLEETLTTVDAQRADVSLRLVVVLPEGATDARALAERFGATIVNDPRSGISDAMNAGIAAAQDEDYYAWIGDDDLFRAGALRRLRDMLDAKPSANLAYGGCEYVDPAGRTIGTSNAGQVARWLLPWGPNLIPHPGSMFRLDALRAVGPFDPALRYAMDLDMLLRLRREGSFVSTRDVVSAFRWHPDSTTVSSREASSAESEAVKRQHLPAWLRPVSPLWNVPVRWAASRAAKAVSNRALRMAQPHTSPSGT